MVLSQKIPNEQGTIINHYKGIPIKLTRIQRKVGEMNQNLTQQLFKWVGCNKPTKLANFQAVSKKSPTGPTERTPKPEYLIALATSLGVRW